MKGTRELQKVVNELIDEVEVLREEIEVLKGNRKQKGKPKKKLKKANIGEKIIPPWEREGISKKEWLKKRKTPEMG